MKIYVITDSGFEHNTIIATGTGPDDADMKAYLHEFEQYYDWTPMTEDDLVNHKEWDKKSKPVLQKLIEEGLLEKTITN